jgi:hypothetical protein
MATGAASYSLVATGGSLRVIYLLLVSVDVFTRRADRHDAEDKEAGSAPQRAGSRETDPIARDLLEVMDELEIPEIGDTVEVRAWGVAQWTAARVVGRCGQEVTVSGDLEWYTRSDGQTWGWRLPVGGGK